MRNLIFVFTVIFSLTGFVGFSYAQDQEIDGEALLEQYLPEGVTLETATEEQITSALQQAVVGNSDNQAALNAVTQSAVNSPRVTNKTTSEMAASITISTLGSLVASNERRSIEPTRIQRRTPVYSFVAAELAADVIGNIIRNSNLTLNQVNQLVETIERSVDIQGYMPMLTDEQFYVNKLLNQIRITTSQALSEQRNEVCTVSNGTTTCVPA